MAWEFIDPDLALRRHGSGCNRRQGSSCRVPVGVKILSIPRYAHRHGVAYLRWLPPADGCVRRRGRGCWSGDLGKPSGEFAGLTPRKRKSRSAGQAVLPIHAAVADNMVPVALGTQTGGPVLRPSSHCGIVGFAEFRHQPERRFSCSRKPRYAGPRAYRRRCRTGYVRSFGQGSSCAGHVTAASGLCKT